jgi:hypothetical protein
MFSGTVDSVGAGNMTDTEKNWAAVHSLTGCRVLMTSGLENGNTFTITGLISATTVSLSGGTGTIAGTDTYDMYPPALTTPGGGDRDDLVYLMVFFDDIATEEDSIVTHPGTGVEAVHKSKIRSVVRVIENSTTMPTPTEANLISYGMRYLELGVLERLNGNANILTAMIVGEDNIRTSLSTIEASDIPFDDSVLSPFIGKTAGDMPTVQDAIVDPYSTLFWASNTTINVTNDAELEALQDMLDYRKVFLNGATLTVNINYSVTSATLLPLTFDGMVGHGLINVDLNSSTLSGTGVPCIQVKNCVVYISIYSGTLDVNGSASPVLLYRNRQIRLESLAFTAPTVSTQSAVYVQNVSYLYITTCAMADGYDRNIESYSTYTLWENGSFGECTSEPVLLGHNSTLHFTELTRAIVGMNKTYSGGILVEHSSEVHCDAYENSNVVIFANTGINQTIADVQRFIEFMPRHVKSVVRLKLPAMSTADNITNIQFNDFYGPGKITLEANTLYSVLTKSQDTLMGANNGPAIVVENSRVELKIDSFLILRSGVAAVDSCVHIVNSQNVLLNSMVLGDDGAVSAVCVHIENSQGIGIEASYFTLSYDGILAQDRSVVWGNGNSEYLTPVQQPSNYGQATETGSRMVITTGQLIAATTSNTNQGTGSLLSAT